MEESSMATMLEKIVAELTRQGVRHTLEPYQLYMATGIPDRSVTVWLQSIQWQSRKAVYWLLADEEGIIRSAEISFTAYKPPYEIIKGYSYNYSFQEGKLYWGKRATEEVHGLKKIRVIEDPSRIPPSVALKQLDEETGVRLFAD